MEDEKRIAFTSPFVPPEWIAAHGVVPFMFRPQGTADGSGWIENRAGVCAFMRAFVNEAVVDARISGLVIATTCDQMRRAADALAKGCTKPFFLMHVPATWQTPGAHRYYTAEIIRLGKFLEGLSGGGRPSPTELASVMRHYEAGRSNIAGRLGTMRGSGLTDALNDFFAAGTLPQPQATVTRGIPVAVVGGPLSRTDCQIFEAIEQNGGAIVLDGTENGERALPLKFDRRRLNEAPLDVLTHAYFSGIPDVFRRPNSALFAWLQQQVQERNVQGMVLARYVWCDCWHAEVHRIKEWLNIPVIDVDVAGSNVTARHLTRIQAFMEAMG
ncbi:MAG: 2-hydroxyacyl-CoA dehydratase family protein [Myxococcota bacterium]|nr:2-hydroxyacyl-CoA dehydratase family protein [Myxococcota bacterium]